MLSGHHISYWPKLAFLFAEHLLFSACEAYIMITVTCDSCRKQVGEQEQFMIMTIVYMYCKTLSRGGCLPLII